ncbi:DUF1361 domain-containing protein [Funiculus sociatus GB2-A5]|uniref:DUF1361 domain-containing protein n=1 Tax=Funiculus sociatus GB2-A5 TaxID=2933946 RepID=A0ABV0JLU1_9CYAN|nr:MULTISPECIES: DUF1361 domain-containing protein [unclassified Trichocoleus]MBD1905248.1 DUF1361 domain-containing protein [Trichocoleus sp. FACHB-832]MBD2061077.1 DUF1361 domain-containing protein [Trichocoleus sp. FACHB-6]
MKFELINWMVNIARVLRLNSRWMTWNLFLAFIPLALSVWLFRSNQKRSLIWWVGLCVFVAFLPNAPYLLTDIIHLIQDIRAINSVWMITLILIPQYLLVILAGFEAYVLSIINLGYYLQRQGLGKYILAVELTLHGLSAVGIFLGRFLRFNSWDLITQPDALLTSVVDDLVGKWPLLVMIITFGVVTLLYWLMKQVSLGIIWRSRSPKESKVSSYQ